MTFLGGLLIVLSAPLFIGYALNGGKGRLRIGMLLALFGAVIVIVGMLK
jgi:hypothetical protein